MMVYTPDALLGGSSSHKSRQLPGIGTGSLANVVLRFFGFVAII